MPTGFNEVKNRIWVWYNPIRNMCYLCYRNRILRRISNKFKIFAS